MKTTKTSRGVRAEPEQIERYRRAIHWAKFHGERLTFDDPLVAAMKREIERIEGAYGAPPAQVDGETSGSPSAPSESPNP